MMKSCWFGGAVAVAVALLAVGLVEGVCHEPRPVFCTNVHWPVSDNVTAKLEESGGELQIQIAWSNFVGSRECKTRFRELQCRYAYPECGKGGPCRADCEQFSNECPGSQLPCGAFPTTGCQAISDSAASSSAVVHSLLLAALVAISSVAVLAL
eukprot:TRINITY_DN66564_c6_g1_i1.p1 TRINITY_DN66564_c6_g1~~TRINITY_DN66564_c6_g1_i1.p1  ORF type:complete len:154 (-),score=39.71 TRINITY_DN66564_c6_g1_i1:153-614(-)